MISYRAQRLLRQLGTTLLVLLVGAAVLLACWFLWLQRYVVYTDGGARLDFSLSPNISQGEPARPDQTPQPEIDFVYGDEIQQEKPEDLSLKRFSGYYVTATDLQYSIDTVIRQLQELPDGSTVMLEMKTTKGEFFYSSKYGRVFEPALAERIDQLIAQMVDKGHYLIARIPAFQDHYYFEDDANRNTHGLLVKGTTTLWKDGRGDRWLNPESDGARGYLINIAAELRQLGFREVVFAQFQYPSSSSVQLPGDRLDSLNKTAAVLAGTCATQTFTVSFMREGIDLTIPENYSRLYILYAIATDVAQMAANSGYADPASRLVFLTEQNDTRFDQCCVLRPIDMAH